MENQELDVTEPQNETVSKEDLKRALDDMHKFKKMAKDLEAQLKDKDVKELKKSEQWQTLAEQKEREASELQTQLESFRNSVVQSKKYSAIRELAVKAGMYEAALDDLELYNFDDTVTIETTSTGRINILGADRAVQELKLKKPHWFETKKASINSAQPSANHAGGKVTYEQVTKAMESAKKSGDFSEAQKLLLLFKNGG